VNLMKFHMAKCKVLHMSRGSPKNKYRLGREQIESRPEEEDLRILVNEKLDMSWQTALAAQENNQILDCIKSSMASRLRELHPGGCLEGVRQPHVLQLPQLRKKGGSLS